jgi:hypothetical protein
LFSPACGGDQHAARSRPLCPSLPPPSHAKIPRAKNFAGGIGAVSVSGTCPDSWGAGERPVVVGRVWLGAFTRAPPARDARAFRARGRPSFPQSITQALGGSRRVRPFGDRTRPLPPAPAEKLHPARQGLARPASGVTPHRPGGPAGPQNHADRTPPAALQSRSATGSGHSRENALAPIHPDGTGPRAGRGKASQASGPRVRPPQTGTHRLPPARAPWAPAIRLGGRWGECGTKREGVEKTARNSGATFGFERHPWPTSQFSLRRA